MFRLPLQVEGSKSGSEPQKQVIQEHSPISAASGGRFWSTSPGAVISVAPGWVPSPAHWLERGHNSEKTFQGNALPCSSPSQGTRPRIQEPAGNAITPTGYTPCLARTPGVTRSNASGEAPGCSGICTCGQPRLRPAPRQPRCATRHHRSPTASPRLRHLLPSPQGTLHDARWSSPCSPFQREKHTEAWRPLRENPGPSRAPARR